MLWLISKGVFANLSSSTRYLIVMILFAAMATFAGVVTARLIERPTLAIRDRLFPARSRKILSPHSLSVKGDPLGTSSIALENTHETQGPSIVSDDLTAGSDEYEDEPAEGAVNEAE